MNKESKVRNIRGITIMIRRATRIMIRNQNIKNYRSGLYVPPRNDNRASNSSRMSKMDYMMEKVLNRVEFIKEQIKEMKNYLCSMSQPVDSYSTSIKDIEY